MSVNSDCGPDQSFYRGPRTLTIQPTFTCTAACRDCGSLSSPLDRTNLPLKAILAAIDQAKELGFANVVFTGGEATLRWKDLLVGIAHADRLGLPTRLVTNAYWATSLERARKRIGVLRGAGLFEINFSTGDEHVRFVPLERIVNAIVATLEVEMRVSVMIELRRDRKVSMEDLEKHPRIEALEVDLRDRLLSFRESPWMPLDPCRYERYPDGMAVNSENVGIQTGCDSILQAYTVNADGRVVACCGLTSRLIPELYVGRVEEDTFLARAVEEAENDFLKIWLRYKGPEKILAWAAEKDSDIEWEDMYAHRCQVCVRLYRDPQVRAVLRNHYQEMYADVLQSAYLDEHHTPENLGSALRNGIGVLESPAELV